MSDVAAFRDLDPTPVASLVCRPATSPSPLEAAGGIALLVQIVVLLVLVALALHQLTQRRER